MSTPAQPTLRSLSGEQGLATVGNSSKLWKCSQPSKVEFAAELYSQSVRGNGTEGDPGQLDIVQDSPSGMTTIEVKHVSEPIFSLAFDGIIIREE